jgi:hypothetical protein
MEVKVKAKVKGTGNPNVKYYKILGKSQLPNPNAYRGSRFSEIGSTGVWDLFGSIGMYRDLGFTTGTLNRKLYIPLLSIGKKLGGENEKNDYK